MYHSHPNQPSSWLARKSRKGCKCVAGRKETRNALRPRTLLLHDFDSFNNSGPAARLVESARLSLSRDLRIVYGKEQMVRVLEEKQDWIAKKKQNFSKNLRTQMTVCV